MGGCNKVRMFVCSVCGNSRPYHAKDMCKKCYTQQPMYREYRRKYYKEYRQRPKYKKYNREYQREYNKKRRNDPKKIRNVCLDLGYSEDIADAIALDGIILDDKMKERGIVK